MKRHPQGQTCPLLARLSKLEEFTHELSNWVGLTMNSLIMAERQRDRWYDHMAVATGLAVRATSSLRCLMLELAEIRRFHYSSQEVTEDFQACSLRLRAGEGSRTPDGPVLAEQPQRPEE